MRILAALSILVASGCHEQLALVPAFDSRCFTPCYGGNPKNAGVGICKQGLWQCADVTSEPVCEGWVAPQDEQCNGQDNNCDGFLDTADAQLCYTQCGVGVQTCYAGKWTDCSAGQPKPETCNGVDDDCDGIVDNNIVFENPYCYDGPASTVGKGVCKPGFTQCINGQIACPDEVLPSPEVCDGLDNNCNGQIDEGLGGKADVVFIADCVGEDFGDQIHLTAAINDVAMRFPHSPEYQFAFVCSTNPNGQEGVPFVWHNFTDIVTLSASIPSLNNEIDGDMSDNEAILDALVFVGSPQNPLALNWRAGVKRYAFLWTDECGGSTTTPPNTAQDADNALAATGLNTVIYSPGACGGFGFSEPYFDSEATLPTALAADVDTVLINACMP